MKEEHGGLIRSGLQRIDIDFVVAGGKFLSGRMCFVGMPSRIQKDDHHHPNGVAKNGVWGGAPGHRRWLTHSNTFFR